MHGTRVLFSIDKRDMGRETGVKAERKVGEYCNGMALFLSFFFVACKDDAIR